MKQFLTSLAANFATIAIMVVLFLFVLGGIVAAVGAGDERVVPQGAVLVVDLDEPISDAPADMQKRSALDEALSAGNSGIAIRAALIALHAAIEDKRISGIVIRGSVGETGYGTLHELRDAITDFRVKSKKPVHAFLVNPQTRDYYVASAASTITLDPFGSMMIPGIAAEAVFLSGMLDKYGVGIQVSRVGKFKAAVEPLTRTSMSPENRLQTERYVGALWSEVKRAIAESRGIDTVAFQQLVDSRGVLMPQDAKDAHLVDRVAYWDAVLADVRALTASAQDRGGKDERRDTTASAAVGSKTPRDSASTADDDLDDEKDAAGRPGFKRIPQVTLADYAISSTMKSRTVGASQKVAVVYASGDIVDGEGGSGMIGGDAMARELRRVRADREVKAVVLRVNSPGGSAIASETIQRELTLIARSKPVVVSMGSVAASGGYWISTAATRIFAEPNTITGSIGVFGLMPNLKTLADRQGVTFDIVKTGRYADLFTITRARTPDEMAILQRGTDAIYDGFIARVAAARKLTTDSVRVIAEGRVWSGSDAMRIGLVDSIGGIENAIRSAASLAKLTGEYGIDEYPHRKGTAELLSDMLDRKPQPLARLSASMVGNDPARVLARDVLREIELLTAFGDSRGVYARMEYLLRVR